MYTGDGDAGGAGGVQGAGPEGGPRRVLSPPPGCRSVRTMVLVLLWCIRIRLGDFKSASLFLHWTNNHTDI